MDDLISCRNLSGVIPFLPPKIGRALSLWDSCDKKKITEIRLRLNGAVSLGFGEKKQYLTNEQGAVVSCNAEDMNAAVYRITQGSVYALSEELRRGYITLKGGHRVGIGGRVLQSEGRVDTIRDISSLNYRVAHAVTGCGKKLLPYILQGTHVRNTLIFSPPCAGKTTLLRDIMSRLSDMGKNVSLIDERSEIAGSFLGQPQLWVGKSTDILDGAPKAEGMMMAIRSLNPEVLVTDEIGGEGEAIPILEAVNSGVALLLSAHAGDWEELQKRPLLRNLLEEKVFQCFICLSATPSPGTVRQIYDEKGASLL